MASATEIPDAVVLSGPLFYQPHITALYGGYKRTDNLFQKATYQKDPVQREGIPDQMSYLYFSLADGKWCVGTKLGATIAELPEAGRSCPPVLIYQAAGTDPEQAFPNLRGYVSWAANLTGKTGYFAFDHLIVLEALFLPEEATDQSSAGAFMHILVHRYLDYEFPPSGVSLLGEPPALKPRRSARLNEKRRSQTKEAGPPGEPAQRWQDCSEPGATRDWVGLASTAPTDASFSRSVLAAVREYPAHAEGLLRSGPLVTDGKYCVCLFDVWEKEWRELCVDDFMPTVREPEASSPTHWAGGSLRPLWVMLVEKALAKLCGSYEALECSHPGGLLAALTGQAERLLHWEKTNGWWAAWRHAFPIVDRSVRMPSPSPCLHRRASVRRPLKFQLQRVGGTWHRGDEFLAELRRGRELHDQNALLLAWILPGERADAKPPRTDGLAEGHGYSIVNFLVEKDVQLVQLRNLWGSSWRGAWSDDSREWLDNPQIRRRHQTATDQPKKDLHHRPCASGMASFRTWLGAAVCFIAWLLAHRFSLGWAAPSFGALVLAALYLWFAVLRVPQFGRELDEVRAELTSELLADPPAAPAPKAPTSFEEPAEAALHASPAEPEAPPVPTSAACGDKAAVPVDGAEAEAGAAQDALPQPHTRPAAQVDDTSARADRPDEAQSEDGLAPEGLQVEEDVEDPVKAQELRLEGNEHFKAGRIYEAREAYSEALHLSPQAGEEGDEPSKGRAVLHCNRAACLQRLGRWDDAVKDCSEAVKLDPTYVKAYARRSTAYEELKKWHDSLEDLKKAIELDPSLRSKESRRIGMLEQRAQEQFEKDKDEMLSKLKELGNTVLGKFGMSTDNFKMEQDPDTGSYSIKFQS
eukprot:s1280_g5.t3